MKKFVCQKKCVGRHPSHQGLMHAGPGDRIFCEKAPHELFTEAKISGNEARDLKRGILRQDVLYSGDSDKEV